MAGRREALKAWMNESVIVADGAMGTMLLARGVQPGRCLEELNLSQPDLVFSLHREYLHAGAQILTTNTFKGNRFALRAHEMEGRLKEINGRAVEIAKRATHGTPVWVGASAGPLKVMLKPYGEVSEEEARDACREQIAALAEAGPDLFILETQQSVLECLFFIDACREVAPDVPVLASLTFNHDGRTFFGDSPVAGLQRLSSQGADVVGINCSVGPADTLPFVEEAAKAVEAPLCVMPNGGHATEMDGRLVYLSNPDYVASYAKRYAELGANIIGGCCGTTPDTIRAIASMMKGRRPARRTPAESGGLVAEAAEPSSLAKSPAQGDFFSRLGKSFAVTCEIDPPKEPDARRAVEIARLLKQAGATAVDIADNPRARVRVSSTALAHLVQQETGLTTILHMTCRDRNLLGLQSELLGASLLGVEGVLALAGDPATSGDVPTATSVNDVNVAGLVRVIASLNRGYDFSDNALGKGTGFKIGVGVNLGAADLPKEIAKLSERLEGGATFAMSQPVFSIETVERFLEASRGLPVFILPGILPLASAKQALYLHNEVPGITLPDEVLKKIAGFESKEDQKAYGIEVARRLLAGLKAIAPGAYLTAGGASGHTLADVLMAIK